MSVKHLTEYCLNQLIKKQRRKHFFINFSKTIKKTETLSHSSSNLNVEHGNKL